MRPKRSVKRQASNCLLVFASLVLLACSPQREAVNLTFIPVWQDQPLNCTDTDKSLSDMRFFVSNVALIDASGGHHAVILSPDALWQQGSIALVDLETGAGNCRNGTQATNTQVRGSVAAIDPVAVRFTVGVPFELNHANPLLAKAPLNDGAMHWHWRSGYKFMRAGITTQQDGTWLHLGSTACEGTVGNISGCSKPNRVEIELPGLHSTSATVAIDLAALFRETDLENGVRSDCSSGPAETECAGMFAALGLALDGGANKSTTVFRLWP